ncbi:DUF2889 domain-containing protein [Desulfonema magnum]|uniref:DUF2889 n=1 Tax=Desulfonema magnum TaxID=45655 RepID=A0A975GPL0_9BACT|nr:DUF2889 domain-containing protein [Desulfonema magnum]QTA88018.1 DUF2889 [Desulfonema magnum]
MNNILTFSRNRSTNVEQTDEQTIRSSCRLQDTLTEAYVEITARLPDLEITTIQGEVRRSSQKACLESTEFLQKAVGVRIGPGMLEIIKGLLGSRTDCKELIFMVEECCHGVILSLTKDTLLNTPKEHEEKKEHYANMVRNNIRLYNRCAAFAPGSSLVEGLEPPK